MLVSLYSILALKEALGLLRENSAACLWRHTPNYLLRPVANWNYRNVLGCRYFCGGGYSSREQIVEPTVIKLRRWSCCRDGSI